MCGRKSATDRQRQRAVMGRRITGAAGIPPRPRPCRGPAGHDSASANAITATTATAATATVATATIAPRPVHLRTPSPPLPPLFPRSPIPRHHQRHTREERVAPVRRPCLPPDRVHERPRAAAPAARWFFFHSSPRGVTWPPSPPDRGRPLTLVRQVPPPSPAPSAVSHGTPPPPLDAPAPRPSLPRLPPPFHVYRPPRG